MLQSNKATQNTDIPTKLIKANADFSAESVFTNLKPNLCFPIELKGSKYNTSS